MSDEAIYILRRNVKPNVDPDLKWANGYICTNPIGRISRRADMRFWIEPQFGVSAAGLQLPEDYETDTDVVTYRWKGQRTDWSQEDVAAYCRARYRVGTYASFPPIGVSAGFSDSTTDPSVEISLGNRNTNHPILSLLNDPTLTYWQWRISIREIVSRVYIETYRDKSTGNVYESEGSVSEFGVADFFSAQMTTGFRLNNGTTLFGQRVAGTLLENATIKAFADYN